MPGTLLKIKEALEDLKPSERKIANYILNNTDEVIGLSIGELASRSGSSEAAVVRLCKATNLMGTRILKST
jgi:DNA-binding MurR/RpiR family transcriptional regulator